ncbi:MAG: hypothetical protein LBL82_07985 [Oscillospiraceae bacterium]|jgi:hypothetical protein|nr:hypothetical protein [Oscillospiraceae bacterium]
MNKQANKTLEPMEVNTMTVKQLAAVTPDGMTFLVSRDDWGIKVTFPNAAAMVEMLGLAIVKAIKPNYNGKQLQVELKQTSNSLDFSNMPNAYEAYVLGYGK